jgi:HEXXH motif-containing protein
VASRNRQLLQLRAVLDYVSTTHVDTNGPLPSFDDAWHLLTSVEEHAPVAWDRVLGQPQVGAWAAYVLRNLDTVEKSRLWTVLGQLHTLAAATAIHSGLDFKLAVPLWNGDVVLPTLGHAHLPDGKDWQVAEIISVAGRISVNGLALPRDLSESGEGWQPARKLRVAHNKNTLEVHLDHLDPYRGFDEQLSPDRLEPSEVKLWQERLSAAWHLLSTHHAPAAEELAEGLSVLVPRFGPEPETAYSASSPYAFGCVALSLPADATELSVGLVHEFQHSKLAALMDMFDLVGPDSGRRFYAPWRPDPRPLSGLLHGAYSFLGITAFWRAQRNVATGTKARLAHFEFAHWREQTAAAIRTVANSGELTELGQRFLAGMASRLEEWQTDSVPQDLLAAARLASNDHYGTWRLRHLHPDTEHIVRLAKAWLTQEPRPAATYLEPEPQPAAESYEASPRTALTRLHVIQLDDAPRRTAVPDATPTDLELVNDATTAIDGYRAQVVTEPHRSDPWVGLALASKNTVLLRTPELVRALYQEITTLDGTPPDPLNLAIWLLHG